ncbi:endonuclease Q family protein [Candidatus Woesearchaeota archaeon]|nr:endonuclease Q family protein [Candidatus Woesearchaeota archaeon]
MKIISDLHLHSKYARGTSKDLDVQNLEKWGRIKGLNLLGTGDFTHPEWIKELKAMLADDGTGILKTKGGMNFVLQTEVSLIYTDEGKGRRVHNVILAPGFEVVDQITEYFKKHGRIDYDGRPIFKIPCVDMTESLMEISKDIEIIPAHIWTPWFALLGSMSGYNSVKDAFKDKTNRIHALETGLSSDPPMNWRLSQLDDFALVSFSDSHSFWPWRIGREATLFDLKELTYKNLINAIRTKEGLAGTIEVDPAYGKYHFDGHRACGVCLSPDDSMKLNNICPKCKKTLTIGVDHRVEELADRPLGFRPKNAKDFKRLIPLQELVSLVLGAGIASKKVWAVADKLMKQFGSELNVLLEAEETDLVKASDEKLADVIIKNRNGDIKVKPGYDGVYGVPLIPGVEIQEAKQETFEKPNQRTLGDF